VFTINDPVSISVTAGSYIEIEPGGRLGFFGPVKTLAQPFAMLGNPWGAAELRRLLAGTLV
jgi:hypothetical protein